MSSTNSWDGKQGQWKGDGTNGAVLEEKGNGVIRVASPKRGTPFNVYYDMNLTWPDSSSQDAYYEVVIDKMPKGTLSVGLVTPDECKPGWKTRGIFYNGNLTNGSAALVTSFGPHLKEKDRMGVRCFRDCEKMDVVLYHNGRCLGKGFQLQSTEISSAPYYPCLHIDGEVEVSFSVPAIVPSEFERGSAPRDGFAGKWKLIEALDKNELAVALPVEAIIMELTKEANGYSICIKVGNTMRSNIALVGDPPSEGESRVGVAIQVGDVISTLMIPPPGLQAVETFMSQTFKEMELMSLMDDGSLQFEGSGAKAVFEAFTDEEMKQFCTHYRK